MVGVDYPDRVPCFRASVDLGGSCKAGGGRESMSLAAHSMHMWYFAEILFAQPKRRGRRMYLCESCNVLFNAATATAAYRKAVAWGKAYTADKDSGMKLLGVFRMASIGDSMGDGIEVCGRFFHKRDVWTKRADLIPDFSELRAV